MDKQIFTLLVLFVFVLFLNSCRNRGKVEDTQNIQQPETSQNDLKKKELELKEKELQIREQELKQKKEQSSKDEYSSVPGDYPEASSRYLTANDLTGLSKHSLRIMRNEIFARYGYIFKTDVMRRHFMRQSWYTPLYNDVNSLLTSVERENIKLIQSFEKR